MVWFATKIVPSLEEEADALTLNYDIKGNPWPIRIIRAMISRN